MRRLFLLAALLLLGRPAIAEEDELGARSRVADQVQLFYIQKKFDQINALAEQLRIDEERTPAGEWKLSEVYKGLMTRAGFEAPTLVDKPNEARWKILFQTGEDWMAKNPSPTAVIAQANLYINYAWGWRGTDTASNVKPERWEKFFANLKLAHDLLMANKAAASVDPEWYKTMIVLARAEQWAPKESAALFHEALTRDRYYTGIYNQIADYLSPQWGGSWEAVDKFADWAAANTADKAGHEMYARIYWHVADCGCAFYDHSSVDWGKMKAGLEDLLARYPNQWNVNAFASFACRAQDRDEAKIMLGKLTDLRAIPWDNDPNNYYQCKSWALGA